MMKRLTHFAAKRFAPGHESPANLDARTRVGLLEGWVSIVANTFMAVVKGALGYMTGSVSLLADAAHTFADSGTSIVVIFGFRAARKPADSKHPFGHGRMESIASLVIAVLLALTAFEMGRAAIDRIMQPQPVQAPTWAIVVIVIMMLAKELMARFSSHLGSLISSDALQADAWHHRSDVFATGLVAVAFVASRYGIIWLDGIAGVGVALLIAWAAWEIMKQAADPLIGIHAPKEMYASVAEQAAAVNNVLGVHDIIIQCYGATRVISLHVQVPGTMSLREAHAVGEEVEERVMAMYPGLTTVHVDPIEKVQPEWRDLAHIVESGIRAFPKCESYHDLRVRREGSQLVVTFDIGTNEEMDEDEQQAFRDGLREHLRRHHPQAEVVVNFDPPFCHDPAQPTGGNAYFQ